MLTRSITNSALLFAAHIGGKCWRRPDAAMGFERMSICVWKWAGALQSSSPTPASVTATRTA